jgi:hypothetical protein
MKKQPLYVIFKDFYIDYKISNLSKLFYNHKGTRKIAFSKIINIKKKYKEK